MGRGEPCLSLSFPQDVTGGDQPHGQGGHPSPQGQGKAHRYLWDLEWLGKERVYKHRGIKG